MLYHLALYFQPSLSVLNIVHYISFRATMALLTALGVGLCGGHLFITRWGRYFSANSRVYTPENHRKKDGIPTMAGIVIIAAAVSAIALWTNWVDARVWLIMMTLIGFGALGAYDDWCKINKKGGIPAGVKFGFQCVLSLLIIIMWLVVTQVSTTITMPFVKTVQPDIGILLFVMWSIFILVGCSNAVNLTDGIDGLAIGSLIPTFSTFTLIAYVAGHTEIAAYLHIPWAATAEVVVAGAALVGASLSFLWYNAFPAQMFMGDVGSLSLGAVLALIALMTKQELLLAVAGGLFVVETVTVMLQIIWVKIYGSRLFRMAPIHHHFELIGWPETKIMIRFSMITFVLCLLALITLKIR